MQKAHLERLVSAARSCLGQAPSDADIASILIDAAYHVVHEKLDEVVAPHKAISYIRDLVRNEYGLTQDDINCRRRQGGEARQLVMWLARKTTTKTVTQIGRVLHRDHTSITYGVRKIEKLITSNPAFAARAMRLASKLGATM